MTFLATQPPEERQQLQLLQQTPGDPDAFKPGFFQGSGTALAVGAGRVGAVASQLTNEAGAFFGQVLTKPLDSLFDTDLTGFMETEMVGASRRLTASMTPDPMTTGTLGRILYGIVGVGLPAAGGAYLGGPAGAAVAAGGFTGAGTFADLTQQGVDPNTATGAAALDALLTAGGVALPAAIGGRVALNALLYGPGINVAQDLIAGQGTAALLESQGYTELAERYSEIDAEMLAADAVLGVAFGWAGARAGRVPRGAMPTAVVDAAQVALDQRNIELDTAPGIPANLAAVQAHTRALQSATEALLDGRPVEAEAEGMFVPKPAHPVYTDDAMTRAFRESGYPELLAEVKGLELELAKRGRVADDGDLPMLSHGAERRGDRAEMARLTELRAQRAGRRLAPDEADELLTLEYRDRMAAKVAGRRIPGVLNMEARNEAEASGKLLPVQAFADADNFKMVNDELGHEVGDQVIAQMGRLFAQELGEGNVFHRGGDEFVMQAKSSEKIQRAMESVRATLADAELVATRADGTSVSRRGVRFSYGEGKTVQEAESAQYADKAARKAAGLRTDRNEAGAAPADAGRAGEGVGKPGVADREGGAETAAEKDPGAALIERQAAEVIDEAPDLQVVLERGQETTAADAMKAADEGVERAEQDAPGFSAAVGCFLRNGS